MGGRTPRDNLFSSRKTLKRIGGKTTQGNPSSFLHLVYADGARKLADSLDTNGVSGVEVWFEGGSPWGAGHDATAKILSGWRAAKKFDSDQREAFVPHVEIEKPLQLFAIYFVAIDALA